MKRFGLAAIALLIALAIPLVASGQGITYTSGFQVQNLEAAEATIEITFYNQDGSVAASVPDLIPASGTKNYFPLDPVQDGFSGSVVIQSNKDIRAIANILGNSASYGASYGGFTQGATTVSVPLLMKDNGGFNTWYNVQNTGTTATTVNISYSDGTSNSCVNLQPGAACTVNQADEAHPVKVFSATISAAEPVAVTVMEVGPTTLFAYTGFTQGSTDLAMPLINANNSGYRTGVQIQNLGADPTTVTVSYTPTVGNPCQETQTIPGLTSKTFAFAAFTPGGVCGGSKFVGSARVTANSANMPLVAIVNQLNSGANKGAAYEAFDPAAGTSNVVMPLIMDRNSNYWTGFSVVNVGGNPTTVTCVFTNNAYSPSMTINPGQAMVDLQNGKLAPGYVGSATCTASDSGKIVGIVNELNTVRAGDAFLVYDAFNK